MVQIIPAILATTEEQYQSDIGKLSLSGSFKNDWVHIDFADNIFVQNKTIEPEVVSKFPADFTKEAHLMVSNPKDWIEKCIDTGFKRIIIHIEAEDDAALVLDQIRAKGLEVGLAINNETPIERLEPLMSKISTVLVMSIVPGFQGQPFIMESLNKIKEIKAMNWQVRVGVDGAVKDSNIKDIISAGADFVIVGSYLLEGDIDENLEKLWEAMNE